ncbi:MAG: cation:dicarboxylase symporter family transporter [Actinomycetota bacterium]|nr:cation:dicarboxylase symporter family transporter [Actinomycetota bacterium]
MATHVNGSQGSPAAPQGGGTPRDKSHYLYTAVIVAVLLGILVGFLAPDVGKALRPLGTGFVNLIKMMIGPIIFTTIVLGIGSVRQAASVGRVGGLALAYFLSMSTIALAIGLVVGNLLQPGSGLQLTDALRGAGGTTEFLLGIIPTSLVSALTSGQVLQALFVALLVGFALQTMGEAGQPVLRAVEYFQRVIFRVLGMIMWVAPIGAIAAVVGATGLTALKSLAAVMIALEHLGISRPVVGVVVPTGYSFNLDGTAIYLSMASLFVAEAVGMPLSIGEQISLLLFMIIASKGAAGVTGAGLATLAGGLQSHRPDLLDGVGLIVGIDRFMSEARALTNFAGNSVATVLVGSWTGQIDKGQAERVLSGDAPFDERSMAGSGHGGHDDHVAVQDSGLAATPR